MTAAARVAAIGGGVQDGMTYLAEPDPFRRLVMRALARAGGEWVELHHQNGTASAFGADEG